MLNPGTKLGAYEILSPLGSGGMGEVYRARDTRLDRTVAIKVLPSHLADSAEAQQRFDREARAISSLSHPHICTLFDVGRQESISFLVMECLEGETLGERLRRGPLPLDQVLRYGIEISEGLEKAHRNGVIHRDLKPGNVMLTKSGAKLMDFGLAKPASVLGAPSSGLTATLAGNDGPLTAQGMILGTFQYMAPEQIEGREADARSDIFSLGAVLYEMVAGKRAFEGKTAASTVAAILAAEPKPISAIQPLTPQPLDQIIRTCLAKDPDDRWQSSGDVARQLRWLAQGPQALALPASQASPRRTLAWIAALLLLAVAAFLAGNRWSSGKPAVTQFEINPPAKTYFNFRGLSGPPIPSPDGDKIAFVAFAQAQTASRWLWLRSLDSAEARQLPGTEGANYAFWSPDGHFLAFFASGKLKKLDLSSGSTIPICDVYEGRGGTWSTDGLILFGNRTDSLYRVSASGGKPVRVTTLDESRHETSHRFPQFLPDQKHFLFVAQAPLIPTARLYVGSLDSAKTVLIEDVVSSDAIFANGELFYVQENSLLARRFDPKTFKFMGEPVALAEHVQTDPQFNYAAFSASPSTLLYQSGAIVAGTRLVVYDRSGKSSLISDEHELMQTLVLSPREDRLAASLGIASGQLNDIWVYDLHKNSKSKLTFDQHSFTPVWSHDGTRLIFDRVAQDGDALVVKDVSGSGAEEVVYRLPNGEANSGGSSTPQRLHPLAWTPDGKYLIYRKGEGEINVLSLGEHKSTPLLSTKVGWTGVSLSPDGKWLAYNSIESGIPEVYVVPFHIGADGVPSISGGKWQVSDGGGTQPLWRADGKELFFTNTSQNTFMSAAIGATGDHFQSEKPQFLFDLDAHPIAGFYTPSRDGQKIYMATYGPGSTAPITVTINWMELLKK